MTSILINFPYAYLSFLTHKKLAAGTVEVPAALAVMAFTIC